jgi:hypothetical protein
MSPLHALPWCSLRAIGALSALLAVVTSGTASAQLLTFTSRGGQDTVYCGVPGSGPLVQHNFSTPTATSDAISVSDPGNGSFPPSAAAAALDAVPGQFGLSMAQTGSAMRGALTSNGVYATADTRDGWQFTVPAPTRFALGFTLSATSTEATTPTQAYQFFALGGGAQIIPDPGTPAQAFLSTLAAPGSISLTATGTLTAGLYYISLAGRMEGSSFPFSGSFDHSLVLSLGCGTLATYCTSGTTSNGCTAQIQSSGIPSVSATSGFSLDVIHVQGASQGLIFYGLSGRTAAPWGTSSSFVCVKSPTQRTGTQNCGGTAGACDGAMHLDWNAYVSNHPAALGAPFSVGQLVQAQGWFRDPPSPKSTMLSDALEFAVCP